MFPKGSQYEGDKAAFISRWLFTWNVTEVKVVRLAVDLEALRAEVYAGCRDVAVEVPLAGVVREQGQETSLAHFGVTQYDHLELLRRRTHLEEVLPETIVLWNLASAASDDSLIWCLKHWLYSALSLAVEDGIKITVEDETKLVD